MSTINPTANTMDAGSVGGSGGSASPMTWAGLLAAAQSMFDEDFDLKEGASDDLIDKWDEVQQDAEEWAEENVNLQNGQIGTKPMTENEKLGLKHKLTAEYLKGVAEEFEKEYGEGGEEPPPVPEQEDKAPKVPLDASDDATMTMEKLKDLASRNSEIRKRFPEMKGKGKHQINKEAATRQLRDGKKNDLGDNLVEGLKEGKRKGYDFVESIKKSENPSPYAPARSTGSDPVRGTVKPDPRSYQRPKPEGGKPSQKAMQKSRQEPDPRSYQRPGPEGPRKSDKPIDAEFKNVRDIKDAPKELSGTDKLKWALGLLGGAGATAYMMSGDDEQPQQPQPKPAPKRKLRNYWEE